MKLHEVVAIRKGTKSRSHKEVSELHKLSQKPAMYVGLRRDYRPVEDEGEKLPSESKKVQLTVDEVFRRWQDSISEAWDIELTQEVGNQHATAELQIGDEQVELPATFLLYMEKQLSDFESFVEKLPVLDSDKSWERDGQNEYHRSETTTTARTTKITDHKVVVQATDKHPAQVVAYEISTIAGHWDTTHLSGAMPEFEKRQLLDRIHNFRDAVKTARSRANDSSVDKQAIASKIFKHLFSV